MKNFLFIFISLISSIAYAQYNDIVWERINLPDEDNIGFTYVSESSDNIYLTANSKLFVSENYGNSWELLRDFDSDIDDMVVTEYGKVFIMSKYNIFTTDDNGQSWTDFYLSPPPKILQGSVVMPSNMFVDSRENIYFGCWYQVVIKANFETSQWDIVYDTTDVFVQPSTYITDFVEDTINNCIYYSSYNIGSMSPCIEGIYASYDDGHTWTRVDFESNHCLSMTIDKDNYIWTYADQCTTPPGYRGLYKKNDYNNWEFIKYIGVTVDMHVNKAGDMFFSSGSHNEFDEIYIKPYGETSFIDISNNLPKYTSVKQIQTDSSGCVYLFTEHNNKFYKSNHAIVNSIENLTETKNNITVTPNPFDYEVCLNIEGVNAMSDIVIRMYNLSGQIVKELKFTESSLPIKNILIPTNNLQRGVYIITVSYAGITDRFKVVK